ncbi:MAG: hypothetical protein ACRDLN_13590, partial [Solirubrobacteraceae bacterium]
MRCDIEVRDRELSYQGVIPEDRRAEVAVTASATAFELARLVPAAAPVYYRLRRGRLELSDDLREFRPEGPPPEPDYGALLAAIHGLPETPRSTP